MSRAEALAWAWAVVIGAVLIVGAALVSEFVLYGVLLAPFVLIAHSVFRSTDSE